VYVHEARQFITAGIIKNHRSDANVHDAAK
jgi:hypothetical protein